MTAALSPVQFTSSTAKNIFDPFITPRVFGPNASTSQGMEKGLSLRKKNVPPTQKEVFKDLSVASVEIKGRDSPESGSLYSDYESGQQYEDKVKKDEVF